MTLRNGLQLTRWLAAVGLPTLALPHLAPLAKAVLPAFALSWAALGLFLTMAYATLWAWHRLLTRLHVARWVRWDAGGLWVSRQRVWWTPFTLTEPGTPEDSAGYFRVEFSAVQGLFRVPLGRSTPPLTAVGVWYHGSDGQTREMWLYVDPPEAASLLGPLTEGTGREPRLPEVGLGGEP